MWRLNGHPTWITCFTGITFSKTSLKYWPGGHRTVGFTSWLRKHEHTEFSVKQYTSAPCAHKQREGSRGGGYKKLFLVLRQMIKDKRIWSFVSSIQYLLSDH